MHVLIRGTIHRKLTVKFLYLLTLACNFFVLCKLKQYGMSDQVIIDLLYFTFVDVLFKACTFIQEIGMTESGQIFTSHVFLKRCRKKPGLRK